MFILKIDNRVTQRFVSLSLCFALVASSLAGIVIPKVVSAAAPTFSITGWKDGQDKVVLSFDNGVNDGTSGALNAADFTVSGANSIAITSVTHNPYSETVVLDLASNLNSAGGTDFTISCAAGAVESFSEEICDEAVTVNVYTSSPEDTTGPSVRQLMLMDPTHVFVEFDEQVAAATMIADNLTLTTSDGGDDSSITSVTAYGPGVEVVATGATIAAGSGNTVAVSTSVTDILGNASSGETVTILPSVRISEVKTASSTNTKDEFIELYNFGQAAVDLSGLKLHIWDQGTTTDTNMALSFYATSIAPNSFFLIGTNAFASNSSIEPDATYSTASVQLGDNDGVYISLSASADTSVIDSVGWGTSTKKEGTALSNLAAGSSFERKANFNSTAARLAAGGTDVYAGNAMDMADNSTDFVTQTTTVPQNTFISPEFAGGATFNEGGDTTAPTITGSWPDTDSASFIPSNMGMAGINVSEVLDVTTVNTTTVKLTLDSAPGVNLCETVTYDSSAMFGPPISCNLAAGVPLAIAPHTLTITTGLKDIAANPLATAYTVAFTPQAGGFAFDNQALPFVAGSFPMPYSTSFPPNAEYLNVNFTTSMDTATFAGNVTLLNVTTNTVETITGLSAETIMDANDSLLVDVSGVTFTAGSTYRLTVGTGVQSTGSVAIAESYILEFTAASSVDSTGPVVFATNPADSATSVAVGLPNIIISVDDALSPSTVSTTTVQVKDGTDIVGSEVYYNSGLREIEIFVPAGLEPSVEYTVSLDASAGGIKNVSGTVLQDTDGSSDESYDFAFTTGGADSTAPTVQFAAGSQNSIEVTFSEPVKVSTVENLANWTLESPISTAVPLSALAGSTVDWNPGTMTATLSGFSLTAGATFEVTVGTGVRDLSGNALASAATVGGTVMDGAIYGDSFGTDAGFTGDIFDNPTGFSTDDWGFVPQPGVFPMNGMAGATSNYMVNFPITSQIPASGSSGKAILTFPTGFDVTNAANLSNSPMNADVNGQAVGTVAVNSVTANASARTVIVDFSIATRCDAGNVAPCAGDGTDFISFDLSGITNSSVPRGWETSGYTVSIKTMNDTTLLETMTSMPFFINPAGANSLTVDLTAGASATGTVVVHAWSPASGEMTETANFATDGDGTASVTFSGLPSDYFDIWTDSLLSIVGTDDFQGVSHQPVYVTGSATADYTLAATSGLTSVTVNVTGATGKDIDVIAGGPNGFQVKRIASTTGSDSVTVKLGNGNWFLNIGPHMPMDGGFIMPKAPDYVVSPGGLEVNINGVTVTESSGTANDGTIAFALAASSNTITVNVEGTNDDAMMGAMVFADSVSGGFGTFAETSASGTAILNVVPGTYRIGTFLPGAASSKETQVKVATNGDIFVEGSTVAVDSVTLKISKGSYAISGTVTDGTSSVSGASVFAWCSSNCSNYSDAHVMTETNGKYTLYVNNGTWNVEAFIPGYGPVAPTSVVVSGANKTGINLAPSTDSTFRTISGTVCQKAGGGADCTAGTAMSGIEIFAWSSDSGGGSNSTKTGTDGTYSLRVPDATGYVVEAVDHRKGPLPKLTAVDVSAGNATAQDIVIDTPETVTVNIVDSLDAAVTLGEIFIEFADTSTGIFQSTRVKNNSTSEITLPEGDYEVFVHTPGMNLDPNTALESGDGGTVVSAGVVTVDGTEIVQIEVPDSNTITGTLTDGTDPVANAWVEISDPTNGVFTGATTDASGNYSITLPDGTYQVNAFSPGLVLQSTALVVDGDETANLAGAITDQNITGTVTNSSGDAVPYAFIKGEKQGGGVITMQSDADGTYILPVDDGTWNVTAVGYGFEPESLATNVEVDGASETGNDIVLDTAVVLNELNVKTITPSEGGVSTDSDLGLTVTVPGGATSSSGSAGALTMKETNNVTDTSTTDVIGNGFEISMVDGGGTQLTNGFTEDVTIQRTVTAAVLATEGVDTLTESENLNISYYDSSGTWVSESTTVTYLDATDAIVDPAADLSNVTSVRLKAAVDHFTVFSITAPSDGVAPAAPGGVTATGSASGITISWNAVTTNADATSITDLVGYEIYRDTSASGTFTTQLNTSDILTTSYLDSTANPSATYYYKVTAADTGGLESVKSSTVNAVRTGSSGGGGGSPGTVSVVTSEVALGTVVDTIEAGQNLTLTWTETGSDIYDVDVAYSLDGGSNYTSIVKGISGSSYVWSVPTTLVGDLTIMIDGRHKNDFSVSTDTDTVTVTAYASVIDDVLNVIDNVSSLLDEALGIETDSEGRRIAPATRIEEKSPFNGDIETVSDVRSGQFVRSYNFPTVYYVTSDMERRPFWDAKTYFSWADDWKEVVWVTDATLVTMPIAIPMLPNSDTSLVKIQSDPKVYMVVTDANGDMNLRWITSEELAKEMYGDNWADYILDLEPTVFGRYIMGSDVETAVAVDQSKLKTRVSLATHR